MGVISFFIIYEMNFYGYISINCFKFGYLPVMIKILICLPILKPSVNLVVIKVSKISSYFRVLCLHNYNHENSN